MFNMLIAKTSNLFIFLLSKMRFIEEKIFAKKLLNFFDFYFV